MNKFYLVYIIVFFNFNLIAQANSKLNKFSTELNFGYSNKKDSSLLSPNAFFNVELAGRYMFNSIHGIKLDLGFRPLQNDYNFKNLTKNFGLRGSAQYILNLGRLCHFERYAPRFSTLIHLGGGLSALKYKESLYFRSWKSNITDESLNVLVGLTPQYKVNERLELHLDFTYHATLFQDFDKGFKWSDFTKNSIFGRSLNASIGAMYYIGKEKKHVDWYWKEFIEPIKPLDSIPTPKDSLPLVNYDKDKDGILDSLDLCPEDYGLAEYQGCPQPALVYDCFTSNFPVFTFKGARSELADFYQPIFDSIAKCLKENKNKKLIIRGHCDTWGDSLYTAELSLKRAQNIKDELVKRGVESDRLFAIGENKLKAKIPEDYQDKIDHNRVAYIQGISNNKNDIKELETGKFLQGFFYSVQIAAYYKTIKYNKFNKYGKVLIAETDEGFTRYSIDQFDTYEQAYEKYKELKKHGIFQDAIVVAYLMGERITIKEAKRISKENKENQE